MSADGDSRKKHALSTSDQHLAANLLHARTVRGLSTTHLSAALKAIGHPIPPTGITRIEKGQRQVNVSELLALADVLQVAPVDLCVSAELADDEPCDIAPSGVTSAASARAWIGGNGFLREPVDLPELFELVRLMPKTRAEKIMRHWFHFGVAASGQLLALKPPTGGLTEDFLAQLSAAYRELVMAKRAPAPVIAEQTGRPVRTVHGWIAEARKRGYLPPGQHGRAG